MNDILSPHYTKVENQLLDKNYNPWDYRALTADDFQDINAQFIIDMFEQ